MKAFIATLIAASAVAITEHDLEFMKFIAEHAKSYNTVEEFNYRFSNWIKNHEFILEETAKGLNYTVGHNKFSDWSASEFSSMLGYKPHSADEFIQFETVEPEYNVPSSVNWISEGAVNAVQDQGQCGSCWSFSSCAAMEGIDQITNGTLRKFAEQQLVSCVKLCFGCNGGNFNTVFSSYAKKNAMFLESQWAYSATNGECTDAPSSSPSNFNTSGLVAVTANSQTALKAQLAIQPVSIAIQADQRVFQVYTSGVFDDSRCGTSLDHAVTLVGYGTEGGQDYYLMRNSWGSSWGEAGYMKMAMTGDNTPGTCGLQMDAVAPTTTKI